MTFADLWFWGTFGLFIEIAFTAIVKVIKKSQFSNEEWNLIGHTSLWMFPVYAIGLTYGFDLIKFLIPSDFFRVLSYPLWIWGLELAIGIPATDRGINIWSYKWLPEWASYKGIISYVHFPLWMGFGILVEMIKY